MFSKSFIVTMMTEKKMHYQQKKPSGKRLSNYNYSFEQSQIIISFTLSLSLSTNGLPQNSFTIIFFPIIIITLLLWYFTFQHSSTHQRQSSIPERHPSNENDCTKRPLGPWPWIWRVL
mmetsp:Transcript_29385/g.37815  ORF Transcript_29385/g.37815 Transcript_29385/m.37815 type:complete len:118 (+) Transcript_29385:102-455(+)